jgi:hypothetical protein
MLSRTRLALALAAAALIVSPAIAESDEGPSLKVTADWLTANLPKMSADYVRIHSPLADKAGHHAPAQELSKMNSLVTAASVQGCHLSITQQISTTLGGTTATRSTVYEVPLDQMKSVYLGLTERPSLKGPNYTEDFMPTASRVVHVNSLKPVIAFTSSSTGNSAAPAPPESGNTALLDILGDDASLSQRVEKALNHAVHLCSATVKPEVF